MAKKRRQPVDQRQVNRRKGHLFLDEWFQYRGLSDRKIADRLKVAPETVWRWRMQEHRLDTDKIALLASVLECEPEQLWRPPGVVSLDAMLKGASDQQRQQAAELVAVILKTGR